jgi:hypothetical protein
MSLIVRIAKITAAAGVAASALLGVSGTAAAAAPAADGAAASGTVQIRPAVDQSFALAVSPVGTPFPGHVVKLEKSAPNSTGAQHRWKVVFDNNGSATIENNAFGRKCLDTVNGAIPSLVFPATCDGSTKQKWVVQPVPGGQEIRNVAFGTVLVPNITVVTANVFTEKAATTTVARLKQAWKIGNTVPNA